MNRTELSTIVDAARQGKLLLVWGDMPFPPVARLAEPLPLLLAKWQQAAKTLPLPLPEDALAAWPPAPTLSFDPTARLDNALPNPAILRTQHDVLPPLGPRTSLSALGPRTSSSALSVTAILKLAGDLTARDGLWLTWADVTRARSDPDKAHLLDEAARVAREGVVVVLAPQPTPAFRRVWARLLAPMFNEVLHTFALGPTDADWPAPLVPLPVTLGALFDALSDIALPTPVRPGQPTSTAALSASYVDMCVCIRASGADEAAAYSVAAEFGDGAYFGEVPLPLDTAALAAAADPVARGLALGNALFAASTGPLHDPFRRAWTQAEAEDVAGLRLCLRLEASAAPLHALPWECLHARVGERVLPLAATATTPFSRYIPLDTPDPKPIEEQPVRVLVAMANPRDLDRYTLASLDVAAEVESLLGALDDLQQGQRLQVTLLPGSMDLPSKLRERVARVGYTLHAGPTTLDAIAKRQQASQYHIVHILAHGALSTRTDTAALYLEDSAGNASVVTDTTLVGKLTAAGRLPHLVFLAACESARRPSGSANPFVGLAPKLVRAGVPAVVAMQDRVGLQSARTLTHEFYPRLLAHGLVDRALNEARLALYGNSTDWAVPVLFTRLKAGRLFAGRK